MKLIPTSPAKNNWERLGNILIALVLCFISAFCMVHLYDFLHVLQYGPAKIIIEPNDSPIKVSHNLPFYSFFTDCIETPLYEEFTSRFVPMELILLAAAFFIKEGKRFGFILMMIIFTSMEFGWAHGGVEYVFLQGFYGFFFSYLYMYNGGGWRGYFSCVFSHFVVNTVYIFTH